MTKDELKTRLADVLEHPDNVDELITDLGSDLDVLEASKTKIAEQSKTIEEYQAKEKANAINSLLTAQSQTVPEVEEEEKDPKEEFAELFVERFYSDDEKGKELRHGSN